MELKNISYFVIITLNNYVKMSPTDKRLCKGIKYLSCLFSELFIAEFDRKIVANTLSNPHRRHLPRQTSVTSATSSPTSIGQEPVFFAKFSTNHFSGSLLFKSLQFILKNISIKTKIILKLLIGRPYGLLNSRFGQIDIVEIFKESHIFKKLVTF